MKKQFQLTKDGIEELNSELRALIAQRTVLADRIKTARDLGDLRENAEYSSARQDQERNDARISEVEHILQNVSVISTPKNDHQIQLGSTTKLKSANGKTKEFKVVGTVEADPLNGKISDESPIGRALLGKKLDETVEIKTPSETVLYKVIEIS